MSRKRTEKRKKYLRDYQRTWMGKRRREWFQGKKCEWCGSTDRLVIHHLDPKKKKSHNVWSWAKEKREKELAKCIVLCSKCHTEYHAEQLRLKDYHGRATGYNKRRCRCELCRKWNSDRQERQRQ